MEKEPHIEDMSLPCPEDICDGSGEIQTDEGRQKCVCMIEEEDQYDPDRDY